METEHWALCVSVFAMFISIGTSIWYWRSENQQKIDSKRTILLQKNYVAQDSIYKLMMKISFYIKDNHKHEYVTSEEISKYMDAIPKLEKFQKNLRKQHEEWSNYKDCKKIQDIEKEISMVNATKAEAMKIIALLEFDERFHST